MPPKKAPLATTSINALLNQPTAEETAAKSATDIPPKPAAASNKRKASEITYPQDLPEIDDDDPRLEVFNWNCNQVRSRINNLINSGTMKVGEFQNAIGVSSKSYSGFMGKSGPRAGENFAAYEGAHVFFKKRELQGLKEPKKKVAKKDEEKALDLGGIQLEGEATQSVPVHETCDEVRKKIRAYLKLPNITQAGFLREIAKTLEPGKRLQSKQLNEFLGKKGPMAGNTAAVYYAAYVFFEKMRVKDGKAKSKHRVEMEGIYPEGVERERNMSGGYYTLSHEEAVYEDEYGRIRIEGR